MAHNHSHHDHGHTHGHNHAHHHTSSSKRLLIGMAIIFLFAIVEVSGGWWAHSLALMSDAGHMLSDAAALLLAAFVAWLAQKPPSARLSYGYSRAEVLGATLSSVILIVIVIAIVVEALHRLEHPVATNGGAVAVIAFLGFLSNILVAWILSGGEENLNTRAAILHVLSDMLGSVAALIAGLVIYFTHWLPIDPILSLFIAIIVLIGCFRLLKETINVLMESVPKHLDTQAMGNSIAAIAGVQSVHDLHVWALSSGKIVLTAHISINNLNDWEMIFKSIKTLLKDSYDIEHITLQPEIPDSPLYQIVDPQRH